jgi:glyceraldehyde 3-phosphate dehydrogenase
MRIAINGFGRIGKNFLRTILQDPEAKKKLEVVAINLGPAEPKLAGHLFKYDTLMGTYPGEVEVKDNMLFVDGQGIPLLQEMDPAQLPWKKLNVDWVVDCSGTCTKRDRAEQHIKAGAKKVLISAPAVNEDVTIIPGVNDTKYNAAQDVIVSLGSCTTNALMPILKVLSEKLGLQKAMMTTVHAYTNTQVLLDVDDSDPRRSRAAALNIIPTTTGATKMVKKVMPELAGKVEGMALRVPVAKVSLVDLVFESDRSLTKEQINDAFKQASQKELKGILDITMEPLVSSDFSGTNYSVVIDGPLTQANGNLGKVFGWYDNEWGYSVRLKDFLVNNA